MEKFLKNRKGKTMLWPQIHGIHTDKNFEKSLKSGFKPSVCIPCICG
jgi:hypothetical protein